MYRALALALSAALLLGGCGKREKTASLPDPSAASSSEVTKESVPTSSEPAPSSKEDGMQLPGPFLEPLAVSAPQGLDPSPLLDGEWGTLLPLEGETSLTFTFDRGTALNFLRVSPTGRCRILVRQDDMILYESETDSPAPLPRQGLSGGIICRFDECEAETLTLTLLPLEEGVSLDETGFGLLSERVPASAYLPAATDPAALDEYRESLALLQEVTIITGTCWDAQGTVQVIDQNYPALLAALKESCGEEGPAILSTFYPARELVRAGEAGESVATPERRAALIQSLIAHCEEYGLSGIDFDWETPKDEAEWAGYSTLIAETAAAFRERGLLLRAALYPKDCQNLGSEAVAALPRLNLMAYDQFDEAGRHSTYLAAHEAAAAAIAAGFAPAKLSLGLPTYGRPLDGGASWPLYRDAGLLWVQNQADGIYYNSPSLARDKAAFAALEGFGGVFLYHLGGDLPVPDPLSLLQNID